MPSMHPTVLFFVLVFLAGLSIFFALAETAMLSVNIYRIRHLVRQNHRLARQVHQLLERPDRLFSIILLCDTFADIAASAIATLLALHYLGKGGVLPATFILTLILLIFGKVAPKTLATFYPQPIAFIAAWPLIILSRLLYPLIWFTNKAANGILRLCGIKVGVRAMEHLNREELRTLVYEAGENLPKDYQTMVLKVLDLERTAVEDVMVPRNEIAGIDLAASWEDTIQQLVTSQYTRLPIYQDAIDQIVGILHLRKVSNLLAQNKLTKKTLLEVMEEAYFIPEGTPLNTQLLNFRRAKQRIGLVVDEYGDIQGLVTLEDILEEIVGEFTTDELAALVRAIQAQEDGSYLVDGSISIRDLNNTLGLHLPSEGPRTLSGLIVEYLEMLPQAGVSLRMGNQPLEIIHVKGNLIKTVRILPKTK